MAKNINKELDWLDKKAADIKQYVDDNPYSEVEDRTMKIYDFQGEVKKIEVIQKREVIHKSLRDAMKEYIEIIARIEVLREEEKKKKEVAARGSNELNSRAKRFVDGK